MLLDKIEAGDQLGHRVFNLQTSVHLEVVERTVFIEELNGASVGIATAQSHSHGCLAHGGADLIGEVRGWRLLYELLVATLG